MIKRVSKFSNATIEYWTGDPEDTNIVLDVDEEELEPEQATALAYEILRVVDEINDSNKKEN